MIASVPGYLTFAGVTSVDATRDASLAAVILACEQAVERLCRPYQFEAGTATDYVLDAPWNSDRLVLPLVPVRSVTSVYYRSDAKGDASLFTSDHLLTQYTDYMLHIDMRPEGWSKSGRLLRLNRPAWGVKMHRPFDRLAAEPVAEPGSVKVTFAYGHTTPPAEVEKAIYLAASLVMARRKVGAPVSNEGWNGYSVGYGGPFTASAAVHSPDVLALLQTYLPAMRTG